MKPSLLFVLPLLALPLLLRASPPAPGVRKIAQGLYRFEISSASRTGDWWGWWGAPDRPQANVVTGVRAYRGKTRLDVSASAFAGLVDAHTFELRATQGGGMELDVAGSDADGTWHGTFRFDKEGLVERMIRDGEFPDISYERTTYRRPREGEID